MAPKVKFQKSEIVDAALRVARVKGDVTARDVAAELGVSTRPIFTYYRSMEELKRDVRQAAGDVYRRYAEEGLRQEIPFLGFGQQYLRFAREEPQLYRLLFLTRAQGQGWSAMQSMKHLQALVRPTLMEIYQITELEADLYFCDLWFVVHSLSTLIVTGDCPYSDQEIGQILTGVSISICKSIKEITGFAAGTFDRDAAFRALVGKGPRVQEDD